MLQLRPGHCLAAVVEAAHLGSSVHVPELGDAQFVFHICCIQLGNCQRYTLHNGLCILTKSPAMYTHFCGRDNELLSSLWFQLVLYLTLSEA